MSSNLTLRNRHHVLQRLEKDTPKIPSSKLTTPEEFKEIESELRSLGYLINDPKTKTDFVRSCSFSSKLSIILQFVSIFLLVLFSVFSVFLVISVHLEFHSHHYKYLFFFLTMLVLIILNISIFVISTFLSYRIDVLVNIKQEYIEIKRTRKMLLYDCFSDVKRIKVSEIRDICVSESPLERTVYECVIMSGVVDKVTVRIYDKSTVVNLIKYLKYLTGV